MMQSLLQPVIMSDICMQGNDWLGQLAFDREEEDGSEDDDKVSGHEEKSTGLEENGSVGHEESSTGYEENGSVGHQVFKQRCQSLQCCQHMNCSPIVSPASECAPKVTRVKYMSRVCAACGMLSARRQLPWKDVTCHLGGKEMMHMLFSARLQLTHLPT